jgi:DNA-binding XRE family transcriptional regulator
MSIFHKDEAIPSFLDTFWKRLNLFRPTEMNDSQFAAFLGVSRSTLASWKKGKAPTSATHYLAVGEKLRCCPTWLMLGAGTSTATIPGGERVTLIPRGFKIVSWSEAAAAKEVAA